MSQVGTPTERKRRPDWAAFVVGLGLIALALLVAWDASRLGAGGSYARIGPQTVPYAIAICLAILGIWTLVQAVRGDFPEREKQEIGPVFFIVAGLLAQMALIRLVGFSIATGILFALTARGLGKVNLFIAVPVGIVLAFLVWLLFARVLQLSLPAGPIERLFLPG